MDDDGRQIWDRDGYLVRRGALGHPEVQAFVAQFEAAIDSWAADVDASRGDYLHATCRWNSPNPVLDELVSLCAPALSPLVDAVAGPGHAPSRASLFRKTSAAAAGTHGHQDAGYWTRTSSSRYGLTTWVALDPVDERRGALCIRPGSHRESVGPPVDYLQSGFVDPASQWGPEALTIDAEPGDVVLFGPVLWHASHAVEGDLPRRALAIRWVGPTVPGLVAPPPEPGARFGMYNSGAMLTCALSELAGQELPPGLAGVDLALDQGLLDALPRSDEARSALRRLRLHLMAVEQHHASDQRGMAWDEVRDEVVIPVLGDR